MSRISKILLSVAIGVGAAALAWFDVKAALWSVPPWDFAQSYSPPHTEADYPTWFIQGRERLFFFYAPLLSASSAVGAVFLVRSFRKGDSNFSRLAALSLAWPSLLFPLVGYLGMGAFLLIAFAILAIILIGVQTTKHRIGHYDLWALPMNVIWIVLLWSFSGDWFGVYGD